VKNHRKKIIGLFLITTLCSTSLFAQNIKWLKQFGGMGGDMSYGVHTDNSGNIILTGFFSGIADFNPSPSTFNLSSNGSYDAFIVKLDSQGNFIWAKSMGSKLLDKGFSISVDKSNNIYIGGIFEDSLNIDFGNGKTHLKSNGGDDIFLLKIFQNGSLDWAKTIGGRGQEIVYDIKLTSKGFPFLCGAFSDTVDFNPNTAVYNLVSNGYEDVFMLQLDSSGNFVYAKSIGSADFDLAAHCAINKNNEVCITGEFCRSNGCSIDLNPDSGVQLAYAHGQQSDMFIIKLDSTGKFIWGESLGGICQEDGDIKFDLNGNIFLSGFYRDSSDFDPSPSVYKLYPGHICNDDFFILKLKSNGNFVWAKSLGASYCTGNAMDLDNQANIYSCGWFTQKTDFDPNSTDTAFLSTHGYDDDAFIQKLDSNGNFIWVKSISGSNQEWAVKVFVERENELYLTGFFMDTAIVNINGATQNFISFGNTDIFLLKISEQKN
jgi:hypothetical protein